jgi:hypothetical protein
MTITINGSGTVTGISAGGLPDAIITQPELAANVAGNGPAFSYYQSSAQTPAAATWTKMTFTTSEFDTTSGMYGSSRFTPTIAGYYQVSGGVQIVTGSQTEVVIAAYKNGTEFKYLNNVITPAARGCNGSALVYLNGTSDYVELYIYTSISAALTASNARTYFQASMVRAA